MNLDETISLYKTIGHRNSDFLFRWLHRIYLKVHLPCTDPLFIERLAEDKAKMAVFDVLVDDVADNHELRDEEMLEKLIAMPWGTPGRYSDLYLETARKIWDTCISSIRSYPRFGEFRRMFYFDLRQVLSSMEYSLLVNTMGCGNTHEHGIHVPHGCMVVLHCVMDLMCTPGFDIKDLGNMRIMFHLAQRIAHLGNMLNTYPKEMEEKDMSCPIVSLAIRRGLIKESEMGSCCTLRAKALEDEFREDAMSCLDKLKEYEDKIESVDMCGFSKSMRGVFREFMRRESYWETGNH